MVEVLVVMAILIMLSAIVLPVYQSAKRESQKADCINRLRQVGIGMTAYREEWGSSDVGTPIQMGFPPDFLLPEHLASALGGSPGAYQAVMSCTSKQIYPDGQNDYAGFIGLWPHEAGQYAEPTGPWVRYVTTRGSRAVYLVDLNHQLKWPVTALSTKRAFGLCLDGSIRIERKTGSPDSLSWWL